MRKWWQCDKCERILPEDLMNLYADTSIWCDDCLEEEIQGAGVDYDPDPPRKPEEKVARLRAVGEEVG